MTVCTCDGIDGVHLALNTTIALNTPQAQEPGWGSYHLSTVFIPIKQFWTGEITTVRSVYLIYYELDLGQDSKLLILLSNRRTGMSFPISVSMQTLCPTILETFDFPFCHVQLLGKVSSHMSLWGRTRRLIAVFTIERPFLLGTQALIQTMDCGLETGSAREIRQGILTLYLDDCLQSFGHTSLVLFWLYRLRQPLFYHLSYLRCTMLS